MASGCIHPQRFAHMQFSVQSGLSVARLNTVSAGMILPSNLQLGPENIIYMDKIFYKTNITAIVM